MNSNLSWCIISSPGPKAYWWAYRIDRPPSSRSLSVRRLSSIVHTLSTSSPQKPTSPVKIKFHMEPPWYGGTKVCSNGQGHITKMAALPIYGKNLKKIFFFSGTKRPMTLKVVMQHQTLEYYQVCSNDDPQLTLTYFTARSNLVSCAFVWGKKVKQWIFQKLLSTIIWN